MDFWVFPQYFQFVHAGMNKVTAVCGWMLDDEHAIAEARRI